MPSYLESIDSQLAQWVNPTDANTTALAQTTSVANPDWNPVNAPTAVDVAPVNKPTISATDNTNPPPTPITPAPVTWVTQGAAAATNVIAADTNAANTANAEKTSQQAITAELSTIDKTQANTKIDNAVGNQKDYAAIANEQIIQKNANEVEYQNELRKNQEEEIAALRVAQSSENVANQAAAAEMRAKQDAAERELSIQNDISLQRSSIAFAKLWLSFSWAAINQAQQIFTTWMYNLSSLKSSNAKNYADLQVKINTVQFDHIQEIGKLVQSTAEKEFASKERLRDFIGATQNNILKNKDEAQNDIMNAIDTYKRERQAREDKLYSDMNNANANIQKATKDIQSTLSAAETAAKSKIDMLITNGQWNSLSIAQKNQMELSAGVPVGTTAQTIVAKATTAINDRLKAIVWSAVAVPPLILARIHTDIQRSLALNVPLVTATQQAVDKYSSQIPAVKAKAEAARAKAELDASKVNLNDASAEAKKKAADAAMLKANKASSWGKWGWAKAAKPWEKWKGTVDVGWISYDTYEDTSTWQLRRTPVVIDNKTAVVTKPWTSNAASAFFQSLVPKWAQNLFKNTK